MTTGTPDINSSEPCNTSLVLHELHTTRRSRGWAGSIGSWVKEGRGKEGRPRPRRGWAGSIGSSGIGGRPRRG